VTLSVGLVEDEDEREFGLVENGAGVEHVGHEGCWSCCTRGVDDVGDAGREGGSYGVGDDRAGSGPGEDLDLARSVDEDVAVREEKSCGRMKRTGSQQGERNSREGGRGRKVEAQLTRQSPLASPAVPEPGRTWS